VAGWNPAPLGFKRVIRAFAALRLGVQGEWEGSGRGSAALRHGVRRLWSAQSYAVHRGKNRCAIVATAPGGASTADMWFGKQLKLDRDLGVCTIRRS